MDKDEAVRFRKITEAKEEGIRDAKLGRDPSNRFGDNNTLRNAYEQGHKTGLRQAPWARHLRGKP